MVNPIPDTNSGETVLVTLITNKCSFCTMNRRFRLADKATATIGLALLHIVSRLCIVQYNEIYTILGVSGVTDGTYRSGGLW